MKRNNFSLRSHTSLSQKLPAYLEVWLAAFYQHLPELRIEHEMDEDCLLLNMDEVPMVFDTVPSRMVHASGENDVRVNTTGGEKKRFTAVLTVLAAGQYLPTMCVFNGWWTKGCRVAQRLGASDEGPGVGECGSNVKMGQRDSLSLYATAPCIAGDGLILSTYNIKGQGRTC